MKTAGGINFQQLLVLMAGLLICQGRVSDGLVVVRPLVRLWLPLDYPANQPFYKVHVLSDVSDKAGDPVEFFIKRVRLHVQKDGEASASGKLLSLDIGRTDGILRFVRNPDEVLKNVTKGGQRVTAEISIGMRSGRSSGRCRVFVEFRPSSQCDECFSVPPGQYRVPEDTPPGSELGSLRDLGYDLQCPQSRPTYRMTSGFGSVRINDTSGVLYLSDSLDAEQASSVTFGVSCSVRNRTFSESGKIEVLDVNDNPPLTQHGNSTETRKFVVKQGEEPLRFAVSAVDADSNDVNDLQVRIVDDPLKLFSVGEKRIYNNLGDEKKTFLYAEIQSKDILAFTMTEYNFSVIIEDVAYPLKDRQVIYKIYLIVETPDELKLRDVYEMNVSTLAAPYSRILKLTSVDSPHIRFRTAPGTDSWIGVTERTGIVFVKGRPPAATESPLRHTILWNFENATHNETGELKLVLSLLIADAENICDTNNGRWCSYHGNQESCESSCGPGATRGRCVWRTGDRTVRTPTKEYPTCSPDTAFCPDGRCDDLERKEPRLCPQDCASLFTGEVVMRKEGRGLSAALGPCSCPRVERCTCLRPPEEMRRPNDSAARDETSTPVQMAPPQSLFADTSCGAGCVAMFAVPAAGIVAAVVGVVVGRRRARPGGKPKLVSDHISLSGAPSDYVDDVSQNAPSDTSSFGKAALDARWEFPRNRLQFQNVLGEGEFGRVMKAQAWNIGGVHGYTTVAVKMIKENGGTQERQDLMTEFTLLKEISHPNVVRLLGASTEKSGPFYLIVEFAEMGSLRSYLRKGRRRHADCDCNAPTGEHEYYQFRCREPRHSYLHKEQLSFAWQIARGMAYLSDMKLVHRDLAARNVLLAQRKVVKISDFGLSRDVYEGEAYLKKSKGRVPVKWMAIESLEDQIYTSRSDVWSFGVVLWEILTQGSTPYPGVTPQRLYNLLKAGYRMTKPDGCPDELYTLMRTCWKGCARERPCFKEIVHKLDLMLQDTVEYMDFGVKDSRRSSKKRKIVPSVDPIPVVQYTSVLVENEESDDPEAGENIGLVRLFDSPLPAQ